MSRNPPYGIIFLKGYHYRYAMYKFNTKTVVLIIVIVILLVGVGFYAYQAMQHHVSLAPPPGSTQGLAQNAPAGQVVSGFPQNLILNSSAQVASSYSISYSTSSNQYTVTWNSPSSFTALLNQYETYLPANGWIIPGGAAQSGRLGAGLYATNNGATVNISIVPMNTGSQATVTYSPASVSVPVTSAPMPPNFTLIPAFPTQFIVASDAKIFGSTDNPNPTAGTHTVTAMYSTKESITTILNGYINLLSQNGWQILLPGKTGYALGLVGANASSSMSAEIKFQIVPGSVIVTVSVTMPLVTK